MKKVKTIAISVGMSVFPLAAFAQQVAPGQQIIDLVGVLASWLLALLVAVGVLFLVLAGFQMVLARGDETKLAAARSMILWSLIGIAVGGLGWFLKDTVISLLGGLFGPPQVNP